MSQNLAALLYLVAGVLFILALRGLSSPASSRQGNRFGMAGMVIAILTTLALSPPHGFLSWVLVIAGFAIGGGFGAWRARTVQMTAMPQLVAMFHSLVGLAAVMVAAGALYAPVAFGISEGLHIHPASTIEMSLGLAIGAVLCLLVGLAAGLLNGVIVVYGRIQPIITTLATGAIYIGIALFLRPQPGGKVDEDLNWALTNSLGDLASTVHIFDDGAAPWFAPFAGIPTPFVLLALVVLVVWVPFRSTVTGRAIYAIGSAEGAAYMSGLNINRARIAAFGLGGFFAGLGGLFLAIQTSSGNADIPQAGAYTLNSIASVVIGGTSLLGGAGGAIGSVFGAMILRIISFTFRIFDIAPLLQPLFEGIILLVAVSVGSLRVLRVKNTLELFR